MQPNINFNSPPSNSFLSSQYLNPDYWWAGMQKFFESIWRKETLTDLHTILIILSLFFVTLMAYCAVRLFEIRRKEHAHLHHEIEEYARHQAEKQKKAREAEHVSHNPRWVKVLEYLFSENGSDWKLAIIEADGMLEQLLEQLGFKGEAVSDRLKAASLESFRSLSTAWEVHTVRNRIAHEGSAFLLSQHEAKRLVALYESIFRQYGYI